MSLNNSQKTVVINEERLFSSDCPYFNGHFENDPILPGIIQIRLVSEAVARKVSNIKLTEVVKTKFFMPIHIDENVFINIELIFTDECDAKCEAELSTHSGTASTMQLRYSAAGSAE